MLKEKSCTLCEWKYVAENIVVLTISAQIRSRIPIDISFACFILSWPQRQRSPDGALCATYGATHCWAVYDFPAFRLRRSLHNSTAEAVRNWTCRLNALSRAKLSGGGSDWAISRGLPARISSAVKRSSFEKANSRKVIPCGRYQHVDLRDRIQLACVLPAVTSIWP